MGGVMGQVWLQSNNTVADGSWIDGSAFATPASLAFRGLLSGDILELRVANDLATPQPGDIGILYGGGPAAQNQDGYITILAPFRWYKVRRTAVGTPAGVVTAALAAWRPPHAGFL